MSGLRVAVFGLRGLHGVEGGIETHARELYPRLAALGCRVTVFTRARYETGGASGDVVTHPLPAPRGKGVEAAVHALLAALQCIARRPDIVHVHGIGPALFTPLLRACGLRVVVTHHGHDYDADKWGAFARFALRLAESMGVRTANAVITVSKALHHDVLRAFGVDGYAIYNGCDAAPEHVVPPEDPRLAALANKRYALIVGRLTPHKRVEDVITAFASVPDRDARLVVCGKIDATDAYCERLRALAANDSRVLLAGYVASNELPWLYRRAACTVMASSYEGMPLAVLEALANGSRVILTDIPAHVELALPPPSYYSVGDIDALANRLRTWLGAPLQHATRAPLSAQFEWSTIARQTLAVFERAAAP